MQPRPMAETSSPCPSLRFFSMTPSPFNAVRYTSRAQQRLDGAALVHRAVALRDLVERQGQVEHLAWIDLPPQHELDELRQVPAHRRRSSEEPDVHEEERLCVELDAVRHADVANGAAGTGGADRLLHRLRGTDALQHG